MSTTRTIIRRAAIAFSHPNPHHQVSLVGIIIVWLFSSTTPVCASVSRPNFVILIADDLGYGDIGRLGNHSLPTPNIDRIGERGVTLRHHLAAASVCTPSRAAFLTGRYPVRFGMESPGRNRVFLFVASTGGLPATETTFAQSLRTRGNYSTGLFGKWHLGKDCARRGDNCHHPNRHGFEQFFGIPLTNLKDFAQNGDSVVLSYYPHFYSVMLGVAATGAAIGVVAFRLTTWRVSSTLIILIALLVPSTIVLFQRNITALNSVLYRNSELIEQPIRLHDFTDRLVNESIHFVRSSHLHERRPFLLMINFLKVHTAHFPADRFAGKSKFGKYGDSVMELDDAIGRIDATLRDLAIENDTFVYFSSDNGGHLEEVNRRTGEREGGSNGIFRGGKGHGAMEGGIRVPTFVRWPAALPAGTFVDMPTSQMDIFATIHSITGIETPAGVPIDGRNILPLMQQESSSSIAHQFLFHYCGTYLHGVRWTVDAEHIWKLYHFTPRYRSANETKCEFVCMCHGERNVIAHDPPLLFNVARDPSELSPINAESDSYSQIVAKMVEAERQHRADVRRNSADHVHSQFSFSKTVWRPWLQPCCSFPLCRC